MQLVEYATNGQHRFSYRIDFHSFGPENLPMKTLLLAGMMMLTTFTVWAADEFDITKHPDFIELHPNEQLTFDIRYATANNFIGRPVYSSARVYLHREAYAKFSSALQELIRLRPGYKFVIFDALRPRSIQWVLWNEVKGTDKEKYVADPNKGSVHNYGFALDLSLVDTHGRELDMGTPYDDFTPLAEPQKEDAHLRAGKLTQQQIDNRLLLRGLMTRAGFTQLAYEWWHFDALPRSILVKNYKIIE
jgi:zinc D-Ala-D-Ala dipeptidase